MAENKSGGFEDFGVWGNLMLGLKVWASEMGWMARRVLRSLEIRQLRKRLAKEHEKLGLLTSTPGKEEEATLCRDQAKFLDDEIKRLSGSLGQDRERYVAARLRRWGLAD